MENNNLRHIREFKGYSQNYLAKRLGKSQPLISRIENGYTPLSNDTIEQLCKILEVTKEKILNEDVQNTKTLNNQINGLLNQFAENKRLLHEMKLNQKNLEQQLNLLLIYLTNEPQMLFKANYAFLGIIFGLCRR